MRTGRPKVALIVTADERRRLDSLAHRSRSAPHVARRARIILACAEGIDSKAVAHRPTRRTLRRAAPGCEAHDHRRASGSRDYPDTGNDAARRDTLEYARD